MLRAAIFDLDGTLVDSLPGIAEGLNRALTSRGFPTHSADQVRTFIGNGTWMLARRSLGDEASDADVTAVEAAFLQEYAQTWRGHGTTLYPGIRDLLESLHESGMPLSVLSNKPHQFTTAIMEALFSWVPFAAVQGQRPGVPRKPDPTAALQIAGQLGIPPAQIAYVGDSTVDFETAAAAGMSPLLVAWGFHPVERLKATGAPLLHSAPELRRCLGAPHPEG